MYLSLKTHMWRTLQFLSFKEICIMYRPVILEIAGVRSSHALDRAYFSEACDSQQA